MFCMYTDFVHDIRYHTSYTPCSEHAAKSTILHKRESCNIRWEKIVWSKDFTLFWKRGSYGSYNAVVLYIFEVSRETYVVYDDDQMLFPLSKEILNISNGFEIKLLLTLWSLFILELWTDVIGSTPVGCDVSIGSRV